MQEFNFKLNLIIDILREKNAKLQNLAIITENQGTILSASEKSRESVQMLTTLIEEKQKLIDEILGYDDVFLSKYEDIKENFDDEDLRRGHRDSILEMQELIVSINANNEKVIALEKANDNIVKGLRNSIEMQSEPIIRQAPITAQSAPMSAEFKNSERTILSPNNTLAKPTNKANSKPIATINLKTEVEKANTTRETVFTEKQETGKKYKIKSVIEQYKNNRR